MTVTPTAGHRAESDNAAWRQRASRVTPGGVHSNVRLRGPQQFIVRGAGPRLWDVEGNEYVDYLLGQGPNFLGHSPVAVREAVAEACTRGLLFGGQHPLEVEAAEEVLDALGWADMIRFGVSGTEAVQAALRLARAATGRTRIVRFEGHYHGWLDNTLMAAGPDGTWGPASVGQLPHALADQILVPWNDPAAVQTIFDQYGSQIAGVITEPMMINTGAIQPLPDYLQLLRRLCDRHGSVLIFDEVITGFRLGLGGGAQRFGVTPDLATYGKAMAGGWAVAALAGRADLMAHFGTGEVNHSGTFNGSVLACAAVLASVRQLRQEGVYERVEAIGQRLMAGFAEVAAQAGEPLHVQGLPMAFHLGFGDPDLPIHNWDGLAHLDTARYARFTELLLDHGIWVTGRGVWYVSAAHGDREVDETIDKFASALAELN